MKEIAKKVEPLVYASINGSKLVVPVLNDSFFHFKFLLMLGEQENKQKVPKNKSKQKKNYLYFPAETQG